MTKVFIFHIEKYLKDRRYKTTMLEILDTFDEGSIQFNIAFKSGNIISSPKMESENLPKVREMIEELCNDIDGNPNEYC